MRDWPISTLTLIAWIILGTGCSNKDNINCVYTPTPSKDNPQPQLSPFKACAHFDENGSLKVAKKHLDNLYYDQSNLASVRLKGAIYYIHKNGKSVQTHFIDNGPDYFSEDLVRYIHEGKYGFVDRDLNISISAKYDYAEPFKYGLSAVCNNCSESRRGGHIEMTGGRWGYIDKLGNEVVAIEHDREKLPVPPRIEHKQK